MVKRKINIGLLLLLSSLLLSCGDEWVCTCEQEKMVQDNISDKWGMSTHHMDEDVVNNYYKHIVKRYCEKREPIKDSCEIIIENIE